nr:MAG TPA: hypothetical protein [Bacteriophage sp.]
MTLCHLVLYNLLKGFPTRFVRIVWVYSMLYGV